MSNVFVPKGPERYAHQKRGLKRLIQQKGVGALLFDPGLGKTSCALDFISVLALQKKTEVRVLVVCPLVAVDTWVSQCGEYLHDDVAYWAEVLGGTTLQKVEALASRGGQPFSRPLDPKRKGTHPRGSLGRHPSARHPFRALYRQTRPEVDPTGGPNELPGGPRVVLEVLNMDALSLRQVVGSRNTSDILLDGVKRFRPDLVVVDESHRAKSPSSNLSRLLGRIGRLAPRRIIMTGTVMPHDPLDVFGQWRFLDPYEFGSVDAFGNRKTANFAEFKARYAKLGGWMGKEVVGFQRLDELQDRMARLAIVAKKEESLDLPKTTDAVVRVDLTPKEARAYADLKKNLFTQLDDGQQVSLTYMLTQALRLRQVTSGYLPDGEGNLTRLGESKTKAIVSLLQDTLAGERRVVVFCQFTEEIRHLSEVLGKVKGTEVLTITGATPTEQRREYRKRFASDSTDRLVIVAQIQTMSLAVNELVTASHAVFASMSQQRDEYVQARDRLNRIGQTRPVTFWHAVAPGTVDQIILDTHRDRGNLEDSILAHIRGAR